MRYKFNIIESSVILALVLITHILLASDSIIIQGMLKDGNGVPLATGTYNMRFWLFDAEMDGGSLWNEYHTSASAVDVVQGHFSVELGAISPFSEKFFVLHPELWLEVTVDLNTNGSFEAEENFSPRIEFHSVAYAFMAKNTDSFPVPLHISGALSHPAAVLSVTTLWTGYAGLFLNNTVIEGDLIVVDTEPRLELNTNDVLTGIDVQQNGVSKWSNAWNAGSQYIYWYDFNGTPGTRMVIQDGTGYVGIGTASPAATLDVDGAARIKGVPSWPAVGTGGSLELAYNASLSRGYIQVWNRTTSAWGTLYLGDGNVGIGTDIPTAPLEVHGLNFTIAKLGVGDYAVYGEGSKGGYFKTKTFSGEASAATGHYGLSAQGDSAGGYFKDSNGTGEAWVAYTDGEGREEGIMAKGAKVGGHFLHSDENAEVRCGYKDLENKEWGLWAEGIEAGGYFQSTDGTGKVEVASHYDGIAAFGSYAGGIFDDTDQSSFVRIAHDTSKCYGVGDCTFVQNHPYENDRIIVYAAPEGDEVATYTRGSGRLVNGKARVSLGDTFKWVTNPDIGLSAQLTPREDCKGLYVASLSTEEMVVRELHDGKSSVAFDYIVNGLRIGFEEASIVQEKDFEARIPSMSEHQEIYAKAAGLRDFNALERFKHMLKTTGTSGSLDLAKSQALIERIEVFDPAVHKAPEL